MSNNNSATLLNSLLYRPIHEGNKYVALFLPSEGCKPQDLGNGDTYHSINEMKDWVLDTYQQINKKEAKKHFSKAQLSDTCAAIHEFLYNHFQYKADSLKQNLYSPSCAWENRHEGIDCKSYSIVASCILVQLGIKHYIRKIKQPGHNPDAWSHVYVIVPVDQKKGLLTSGYFTIDGTIATTIEPIFTTKHDIYMDLPHQGLKGAVGATRQQLPLQLETVKRNLTYFANALLKLGTPNHIVNDIYNTIITSVTNGDNPRFNIKPPHVVVGNRIFTLPKGRTVYVRTQEGETEAVDLESFAAEVSSSGFFDNTVMAVFGNNWDMSCWGSSNNPTKSKAQAETDFQYALKFLENGITSQSLNAFSLFMNAYIWQRDRGSKDGNNANCTRKGNEVAFKLFDQLYKDTRAKLRENLAKEGITLTDTKVNRSSYFLKTPSDYLPGGFHVTEFTSFEYTLSGNANTSTTAGNGLAQQMQQQLAQTQQQLQQSATANGVQTGGAAQTGDNGRDNTEVDSGIPTGVKWVLGTLALGGLVYAGKAALDYSKKSKPQTT